MKIVDAWMQHPTLRHSNHQMFDSLKRWTGQATKYETELPVSFTLACMDEAQVELALCSAWYGPGEALISNAEVSGFVEQSNGRLLGVAGVDITKPSVAVRELRSAIADGFVGLRLLPWLWEKAPTHRYFYPVLAAAEELQIPFCTQVGHTGPLMPSETGRPIPYIDQVAIDFPDLKIVCGHIGYPWTTEMIAVADKHPNVFIDTSAYTAHRYPGELVTYMKSRGKKKVLFGTNFPMITPKRALEHLDQLQLNEQTLERFLASNTLEVFKL